MSRRGWRRVGGALGGLAVLGVAAAYGVETGAFGFDGLGLSARPYRGPVTDHFDGRRFHDVPPAPRNSVFDVLRWQSERPADTWRDQPVAARPVVPARIDNGAQLLVTFVNHSTVLLQHRGLNILADPVWSAHAGPLGRFGPKRRTPPGIAFDDLPPIDVIVLTHNHYDHFDMPTLARLAARRPQTMVVTGLGNGAPLRRVGFTNVRETDWWQSVPLNATLGVTAVPMRHWSERMPWNANATLWEGFVFTSPDGPVMVSGDTTGGPHFAEIRKRFGSFRFAALPIGAYEPRWFMHLSHMAPDQTVESSLALGAASTLGVHFGTFRLSDEAQFAPPRDFAEAVRQRGLDPASYRALRPGQQWDVPPLPG